MSGAVDLTGQLGAVRDQGPRGTCLSFAVTAAHEQARRRRRSVLAAELGEEILHWSCKQIDGDTLEGTSPRSAARALKESGQSAAALWPYDRARDVNTAYTPPAGSVHPSAMRRGSMSAVECEPATLCGRIAEGHAVIVALELWPGFYTAPGGVLGSPAAGDLIGARHAVALVGFDDAAAELLLRNSWGESWGANGHGRLAYASLGVAGRGAWVLEDDLDSPD